MHANKTRSFDLAMPNVLNTKAKHTRQLTWEKNELDLVHRHPYSSPDISLLFFLFYFSPVPSCSNAPPNIEITSFSF